MIRTANPALSAKSFGGFVGARGAAPAEAGDVMTIQGAVNKTGLLILLAVAAAAWPWWLVTRAETGPQAVVPWLLAGALGGFVFALCTIFKRTWAPVTAPLYALCEGLFLGGISGLFQLRYPGIPLQAVGLTFGVLIALLIAYKSRLIKATENFKLGVVAATGGIAIVYLLSFVLGLFGIPMGFLHSSGTVGIGISLFIVVVAALNLVLDFDFIEQGAEQGAPKYMEWYAAFGLLVTLVWLYLEILRLLAKLQRRN